MALTAAAESQSKRGTILIVVIAVHAIGLWVVESGLSRSIIEMVAPPVETKIIEEEKPPEEPPPPPPPPVDATPPPPYIPPVEVQVQLPPPVNTITAEVKETPPAVTPPVMAPPAPPAPPAVAGTKPTLNPRLSRPPDEFYPNGSRVDKEEGSIVVKCSVGLDGKCGSPTVETSSGFPRLDEAAIKYATQGVRFVPGTEEGKPVAMTHMFKVTFKLKVTR
jgi:protein TonB